MPFSMIPFPGADAGRAGDGDELRARSVECGLQTRQLPIAPQQHAQPFGHEARQRYGLTAPEGERGARLSGENLYRLTRQLWVQERGGQFVSRGVTLVRVEFDAPKFREDAEMSQIVWEKRCEQVGHG